MNKVNYPAELKLWTAVLNITIQDYVHGMMHGWASPEFVSAKEWIFAEDATPKNSFENVCMLCGLNAARVREQLQNDARGIYYRINNKKDETCTEANLSTETSD